MSFKEILLVAKKNNLSFDDIKSIVEYLDHNEYGVALEQLCSAIEQERIKIAYNDYLLIKQMGEQMEMDKSLWERIKSNNLAL